MNDQPIPPEGMELCPICKGSGDHGRTRPFPCLRCNSTGFIPTQPTEPAEAGACALPCPFCGGKSHVRTTHRDHWIVFCPACRISQDDPSVGNEGKDAIDRWNRRSPSSEPGETGTPRTDAVATDSWCETATLAPLEFTKGLERETTELRDALRGAREEAVELRDVLREAVQRADWNRDQRETAASQLAAAQSALATAVRERDEALACLGSSGEGMTISRAAMLAAMKENNEALDRQRASSSALQCGYYVQTLLDKSLATLAAENAALRGRLDELVCRWQAEEDKQDICGESPSWRRRLSKCRDELKAALAAPDAGKEGGGL